MSDKEKTNGSLAMAPRVITIPVANQETARKLRVAAYTRVSSNSKDQEHSFAAQNAYFSKLITDNPDWELADIYADQGITGTSIDKRDDFLRMMEDCRKGRIDRILVKSSSRFARNTKESLAAVRELKSLNISVYFEEQNIDTAQVSGEVLIAMFAALAQRESEAISERVRWSYRVRMSKGRFSTCKAPYDEDKSWNKNMVARILEDDRYIGEKEFPALIPTEQFHAAQERRKEMRPAYKQTPAQKELRKLCGGIVPDSVARKVLKILNQVVNDPQLIKIETSGVPTTEDIRRLQQELNTLLQTPPVDADTARQKALEVASLKLASVKTEEYESHRLRRIFGSQAKLWELDANLLRQSIRKITYDSKTVKVLLKNNQVLEECDDT